MKQVSDIVDQVDRLQRESRLIRAQWEGEQLPDGSLVDLSRAFQVTIQVLESARIPSMLIGGLAVSIHTKLARATIDVDFAIRSTQPRCTTLDAFVEGGFKIRSEHAHSIHLEHRSGGIVKLVFDPALDAAIDRAEAASLHGGSFRLATRADLIESKLRAARDPGRRRSKALRDQADVELLRGDVPEPDEGW